MQSFSYDRKGSIPALKPKFQHREENVINIKSELLAPHGEESVFDWRKPRLRGALADAMLEKKWFKFLDCPLFESEPIEWLAEI